MRWPWQRRRKVNDQSNLLPKQGNPQARRCGKCGDTRVERRINRDGEYLYSAFYCPACDMIERKKPSVQ